MPTARSNSIVSDVDKIKEAAMGNQIDVVEVLGKDCGFLALVSGMATGAELIYVPEEGLSLGRLQDDLANLQDGFGRGKRRGLVVRGGDPDGFYTTSFIEALFEHESGGLFDVRSAILGQVQRGGHPSPFDRIHATRLTAAAVEHLIAEAQSARAGERDGRACDAARSSSHRSPSSPSSSTRARDGRAKAGWWMALRPIADTMAAAHGGRRSCCLVLGLRRASPNVRDGGEQERRQTRRRSPDAMSTPILASS